MKKYRISIVSILLFLAVLAVAYFWHLFTKRDVPFELLSALLGASVTVIITNLLLCSQTESEFDKQKQSKVYEEKFHIYQQYLKLLCTIIKDHILTYDELSELRYQSSLVALHTTPSVYDAVMSETNAVITAECEVEGAGNNVETMGHLLNVTNLFHQELYGVKHERVFQPDVALSQFKAIVEQALSYCPAGLVGKRVSDYKVCDNFNWKEQCKKWEQLGWRKDEQNKDKDCLCFFYGNSSGNPERYVEIRYEVMYGYIIRAYYKGNMLLSQQLQNIYGGYRSKDMWWRVLAESPFCDFNPTDFMHSFDKNPSLKEQVAYYFNSVIEVATW